jgi:hypothetical protein
MGAVTGQMARWQLRGLGLKQTPLICTQCGAAWARHVENLVTTPREGHAWRAHKTDNEWQRHSYATLYRSSR